VSARRLVGLAIAVVLAVGPGQAAAAATAKDGPRPARWDDRVLPYVKFIERTRGRPFKHPIPVEFLADKPFVKKLGEGNAKPTKKEREESAHESGQLHALGLIDDDVDLIGAGNDLDAADTVGFYDTDTKRMYVRGKSLKDVEVRATIVHELTHAFQDQYFDLDRLDAQATTSGAAFAETALVEGDATLTEQKYVDTLSKKDQDAYYGTGDQSSTGDANVENPLPDGVPAALDVFSSAPYVLGSSYVYLLEAIGPYEVDHAFRHPPVSDEEIIDPLAWRENQRPLHVATPKLEAGETRTTHPDEIGALELYLMLASRIDLPTAFRAATGWGGDRSIGFTRGKGDCLRDRLEGDTRRDLDEIDAALTKWAGTLPAGAATVDQHGDTVELTTCEAPGVVAPDPDTLDAAVFSTLDNRLILTTEFFDSFGASVRSARCAADRMVVDPALGPIIQRLYTDGISVKDLSKDDRKTFQATSAKYLAGCGVT